MSPRTQNTLLKIWHAWLAGGFTVAYLTASEDTYAMHQFAGYAVLAAIALRLLAALAAPAAGPLRMPRPSLSALVRWFGQRKGRHPLFAWFAVALLAVVGVVAATGAAADFVTFMEDPHEAVAEASLWLIFAHIAFVTFIYGGKRLLNRFTQHLPTVRLFLPAKEPTP